MSAYYRPYDADSANLHAPTSNTAAVVTYAANADNLCHLIDGFVWSYDGTPTGGNLKVEDGSGNIVFSMDVTAAGPGFIPLMKPLKGTPGTAMICTLAAGGSGVTGKLNVVGKTLEK